MEVLEIRLKMLTPLWTGSVNGRPDRIQLPGIIGSMRWWYEAIVRGLGGWACDPTEGGCIYQCKGGESHAQAYERLCDACRVFGCTGWRRRFSLTIQSGNPMPNQFCLATLDQPKQLNYWWLGRIFEVAIDQPLPWADVNLRVQFMPEAAHLEKACKGLLSLMAHYGGLGAKTQYGFGQFDWPEKLSPTDALAAIRQQLGHGSPPGSASSSDRYTLSDFWHLDCQIPETDALLRRFKRANVVGDQETFERMQDRYLPVSFDIRYRLPGTEDRGLRRAYQAAGVGTPTSCVFGMGGHDRRGSRGSRVFVSHLYKRDAGEEHYQLKVWGFTSEAIGAKMRDEVEAMFRDAETEMTTGAQLLAAKGAGP